MTPQELKNSILQLAVQGKLVEQREEEGTAQELFEEIQKEKQRLIKEGKIKKEKPLPEITEDEKPFEIPKSWKWVRLKDCFSNKTGLSYKKEVLDIKSNNMIRVLRGGNILDTKFIIKPDDIWISSDFVKSELLLKKNTIITPAVTSIEHIGKMGRIDTDYDNMVVGGFVLMLLPHYSNDILSKFFLFAMSSKFFRDDCRSIVNKSGQAFYNLSREKLMQLYIPLPPLAEQKRIVEKIEELLPLVNRYEQSWSKLEQLNSRFPEDMKKSLLQYAVQGKLVEQREEEGTAQELFKEIQKEKQRLIKDGKIKKEKPLPEITEGEKPFDIPDNWKWCRLGSIISISSGDGLTSKEMSESGIYPVYGGNGINGHHNFYNISKRTLVIGRVGFYCGSTHITESKAWVTDNAFITTFDEDRIDMKWLKFYIDYLNPRKKASSTAQPVISGKLIYPMLVPLPPLAEQKRIVEKLEQLLHLCERLK